MAVPTLRQRHGRRGERLVADRLGAAGWTILGQGVRVGRDEIDLVAIDPGPPPTLVFVEVRSVATTRFGLPEESVDRAKVRHAYRAAMTLRATGRLPEGTPLPRLRWRIDLVSVEDRPSLGRDLGGPIIRHLRELRAD
ncbi:MAG TPA: YraN family protein [Candidatus Limnocylindrales bacterium]|nr:YraN family protein [Candidatus Limnocylindrales bacterium]